MLRPVLLSSLAALAFAAPAGAAVSLIARGVLGGTADLSGLTYTMENGVRGDKLGGLGSGLAYAGGNSFLALPDRGPNANPYNSNVDDTASYIDRFQTLSLQLTPTVAGSGQGYGLAYTLTTALTKTTLLYSPTALTYGNGNLYGTSQSLGNQIDGKTAIGSGAPALNATTGNYYFTGRSDNYGAGNSGVAADARLDPESIRLAPDGQSVFISDEYGPYVRQFDLSGKLLRTFALPSTGAGNLDVANPLPNGTNEIAGNTSGRTANKGMEGLAITPDGKTLVGIMQAATIQDAAVSATKKLLRIVTIDIATGITHEYGYLLTSGSGVSEILAVSNTQFLVDERDGKGLGGDPTNGATPVKQLFEIDLTGATDISGLSGSAAAAAAVKKTSFLDVAASLVGNGFTADTVPSKIEGITFGQDVLLNGVLTHTLYVSNDNDFVPETAGDNQFFVFGFTNADLPGFGSAVPEPATWAMSVVGFGLIGTGLRRRPRSLAVRFG